jgi:hypothetical protein
VLGNRCFSVRLSADHFASPFFSHALCSTRRRRVTASSAVAVPYRPVHMQFVIRCRYHRSLRGPAIAVRNIRIRKGRRRHVPDAVRCRGRRRNVAVAGARPDRDSYPPWSAAEHVRPAMRPYLATTVSPKRNSLPSRHMPCSNTASLRATATTALRPPIRSISARPQLCSRQGRVERRSRTLAASDALTQKNRWQSQPRRGRGDCQVHSGSAAARLVTTFYTYLEPTPRSVLSDPT